MPSQGETDASVSAFQDFGEDQLHCLEDIGPHRVEREWLEKATALNDGKIVPIEVFTKRALGDGTH